MEGEGNHIDSQQKKVPSKSPAILELTSISHELLIAIC